MFDTTEITKRAPVQALVEAYTKQRARIVEAYNTLEDAEKALNTAFGTAHTYRMFSAVHDHRGPASAREDVLNDLKLTAWRDLVERLEVRKLMSVKRSQDLDEKLRDAKQMPEITLESTFELLGILAENAETFTQEAIEEAYNFLRPGEYEKPYKTNDRNAREHIGPKVILSRMIEHKAWAGGLRVAYGAAEDRLRILDRVFYALDGKPGMMTDGYRSPSVDALNANTGGFAETEYFRFKAYANGNLHIEFKRHDLLREFNARAGGMNLKSGLL